MTSTQLITITLDGLEVSGPAGMTILQLARESGVHIPTLCSDPNLSPIGACRVCVVQDERNGSLMASCVTPIASGMVINTNSPAVVAHRKNIVSLLLASHPDTCMVCDKGNICQLRQIAADLGIGLTKLYRIPQKVEIMDLNPFIERDLSKCILCGKCIRADQELVVEGAIDYFERGFIAKPATFNNGPLELSECTFCGTCVAVCPTGALSEKKKLYRGTAGTAGETICPYCACGCSVSIEVKDGRIIRVRPGKDYSVNHGALCILGSYGLDFVNSPERLTKPLVKINGSFVETDWENAIGAAADELKRIKEKYGSDSMAVLGSSKCTNEDNYVLQRFARSVLGTNNIDNGSRTSGAAIPEKDKAVLDRMLCSADYISQADFIFVVGVDLENAAPIIGYAVKRAVKFGNARLAVIDPSATAVSSLAHAWLRLEPENVPSLLNSIARLIIEEKLYDENYLGDIAANLKEFMTALEGYNPKLVAEITGVSGEQIAALGRMLASAKKPLIICGTEPAWQVNGTEASLINLLLLVNRDGRCSLLPVYYENNSLGACDMGALPGYLPGFADISDKNSRNIFEKRWNVKIPAKPGMNLFEILGSMNKGDIKGLYIMGENPVRNGSSPVIASESIAQAEFIVVQDIFMSETAKLANVVFPASSFAERDGSYTNLWGRVQKINKMLPVIGESRADWEILTALAAKMDVEFGYRSIKDIRLEIGELVPLCKEITVLETGRSFETTSIRNRNAKEDPEIKYTFALPVNPVAYHVKIEKEHHLRAPGKKLTSFGTGTRVGKTSRVGIIKQETKIGKAE